MIETRDAKRELYAQGVLIMFVSYRTLSDLQKEGDSWWASYLKRKEEIERNSTTMAILHNIQNFYESFCRSGNDAENEAHFHRPSENVAGKPDDLDNDAIDLLDVQEQLNQAATSTNQFQDTLRDPSVAKLVSLSQNPLQLAPTVTRQSVNPLNAAKAVGDLRQSTIRKKFQLPNRAKIGDIVNNDENNDIILDQPKGTRIDLLQNLDRALQVAKHTRTLNDVKEPEISDANFPTLTEH